MHQGQGRFSACVFALCVILASTLGCETSAPLGAGGEASGVGGTGGEAASGVGGTGGACVPQSTSCIAGNVVKCNAGGTDWEYFKSCAPGEACMGDGVCTSDTTPSPTTDSYGSKASGTAVASGCDICSMTITYSVDETTLANAIYNPNDSTSLIDAIDQGVRVWEPVSNNQLAFQKVAINGDIRIAFVSDTICCGNNCSQNYAGCSPIPQICSGIQDDVRSIQLKGSKGTQAVGAGYIVPLVAHEVGHALGLAHTNGECGPMEQPCPQHDIMCCRLQENYLSPNANDQQEFTSVWGTCNNAVCGASGQPCCAGGQCNGQLVCNSGVCGTCAQNACGGCSALPNPPGGSCGCGGTYVCSGQNATTCQGAGSGNACGGCSALPNPPGGSCGCGGTYVCSGQNATTCQGGGSTNACGGCSTLGNQPGASCGCGGVYACSGQNATTCQGAGSGNACGGCSALPNPPGTPCTYATCQLGSYMCNGQNATTCMYSGNAGNGTSCPGGTCQNGSCSTCSATTYWTPSTDSDTDSSGTQFNMPLPQGITVEVRENGNQLEVRACKVGSTFSNGSVALSVYDAATNSAVGVAANIPTNGQACTAWTGLQNDTGYTQGQVFGGIWQLVSPSSSAAQWNWPYGSCAVFGSPGGTCWEGIGLTLTRTCKP